MKANAIVPVDSITGLILAGGRGSRMGGVDKGLQLFQNKTLIDHVIARLAPQVKAILINANQHHDVYAKYGHRMFADHEKNFGGPLAGIDAAWDYCETDYLLTVPCDSPFLAADLALQLSKAFHVTEDIPTQQPIFAAIAATNETQDDRHGLRLRLHPVFCLMHRSAAPALKQFLANGGSKMRDFFDMINAAHIVFDQSEHFVNLNTLQDLREYESPYCLPRSNQEQHLDAE